MSREIKFRAWDSETKEMRISPSLEKGLYSLSSWFEAHSDNSFNQSKKKDSIIMQFTGLIDKNGKEIYEGDIFRINEKNDDDFFDEIILEVQFDEGDFWNYRFNPNDCEVIGNIYENKDLLK